MNEKELSIALGLSKDILRQFRSSYAEGTHWNKIESKRPRHLWEISWTDEGVKALKENIGFKEADSTVSPSEKQGTVYCKYKNPRVIGVVIDGKQENVICRESAKFGIGMPVKVRWDGARWVVIRHPRFIGKY